MKQRSEKDAKLVRSVAVAAFLIAAIVGGWALSRSMLASKELLIKEIEVVGQVHLKRAQVLELAGLNQPKSTFQLNKDAAAARLLSSPWIQEAKVLRPGREMVRIEIVEAVPRLIVAAPHLVIVDAEGRMIDRVSAPYEYLPLLTGASRKLPSEADQAQVDPQTLELSRGLGGALLQDFEFEVVDGGVVRDAVRIVDAWDALDTDGRWSVEELGWEPAEGFSMVVGDQVDIVFGHRAFEDRLARAYAALQAPNQQIDRLQRVDVRAEARAVLRFDDGAASAQGGTRP